MNKTDPDSRMMRTQGQPTVQGYNAQAAVTRGQIIVAAEIAVESPDFGHLEPAVRAALGELDEAGVTQRPETVLADAGYWHTTQMENIVSDGIQVLVPPDAGLRAGARPGWVKGPTRSCAACSQASPDTSSTSTEKRRSSRCSRRTSSTAASAASNDEADPRCARSGACSSPQPPEAVQPLGRLGDRLISRGEPSLSQTQSRVTVSFVLSPNLCPTASRAALRRHP